MYSLIFRVRVIITRTRNVTPLCCHSNATRRPIANPPNSAQLGGIPTIPPNYIRVRAIVWACGRRQTDRHTHVQTRVTTIHFASSTTHAKCNQRIILTMVTQIKRKSNIVLKNNHQSSMPAARNEKQERYATIDI